MSCDLRENIDDGDEGENVKSLSLGLSRPMCFFSVTLRKRFAFFPVLFSPYPPTAGAEEKKRRTSMGRGDGVLTDFIEKQHKAIPLIFVFVLSQIVARLGDRALQFEMFETSFRSAFLKKIGDFSRLNA